jgi:hypothetical protein
MEQRRLGIDIPRTTCDDLCVRDGDTSAASCVCMSCGAKGVKLCCHHEAIHRSSDRTKDHYYLLVDSVDIRGQLTPEQVINEADIVVDRATKIGVGSFGAVYDATYQGRRVCVKVTLHRFRS